MKAASVTVVVPTFNCASTIEAALRSIQRQTRTDWEAIVVDDGSVDSGPDRVARLSREDSRIKLIRHGHNRGAQAARNTGIDAARTAWIAFLISDDKWMPQSLALRLDAAEKNLGLQVVHTGAYVIHENGERSLYGVPAMAGRIYTQLLQRPGPMFQGLLAAKEALTKIGALDGKNIVAMQEWDTASSRLAKHYPFRYFLPSRRLPGTAVAPTQSPRTGAAMPWAMNKSSASTSSPCSRYAGPEALYRHYRTLSERYGEMDAKPDVFRSQTYARLWKLTRSVVHG